MLDKFLEALREQGGSASNAAVRTALGWSDSEYWRIRDIAHDDGYIVLGRGRGGSVRIVEGEEDEEETEQEQAAPAGRSIATVTPAREPVVDHEFALYEPCRRTLAEGWAKERSLHDCHVEVTARQGSRGTGGTWTRPDIVALSMRTFRHWPGRYFDVWTFEVKPHWSFNVTGIYEAAAHSRCATHSYCAFHVQEMPAEDSSSVARFVDEAQRFQVGLILFTDPSDYATWDLRVIPARREPDPALLEEFIATQLSETGKERLLRWSK